MNFDTFLKPIPETSAPSNARVRISADELRSRLEFYESNIPDFTATDEHLKALMAIFNEHRNVFVTGGAGTGKTTFIKCVVLPELDYRNLHWSVTATTGIAGSHLNGKTMHSFFGIGLGPQWKEFYPSKLRNFLDGITPGNDAPNPQDMSPEELEGWYAMFFDEWMNDPSIRNHIRQGVISRLVSHEVLVIDEISMCAGNAMLGYLDYMLRQLRADDRAFGGLQIIFIGDFAQLPPVEKRGDAYRPDWAFLSRSWDKGNVKPVELTRVFRQGEPDFIRFLNNVRIGVVTPEDKEYARQFVRNDMTPEETILYPFLLPKNDQVKAINADALFRYPAPTYTLEAQFQVVPEAQHMQGWERDNIERVKSALAKSMGLVGSITQVRIGTPVMFTVNDSEGAYVNGTRGFVREVNFGNNASEFAEDRDNVVVGVPIEGSDGQERLITLFRRPYSRAKEQDPFVTVRCPDSVEDKTLPEMISLYPTIHQFPLIPATALTIHKSQGLSLERAILALASSFAAGQVYVALSRLRSPHGLVLSEPDFTAKVDPYVMDYYRSMREKHDRK